jgi:O-methyltransferase
VEEFLACGTFRLKQRYTHNNGLTVLESAGRVPPPEAPAEGPPTDRRNGDAKPASAPDKTSVATGLYLDLLKLCLVNWIYGDSEVEDLPPAEYLRPDLTPALQTQGLRVVRPRPFEPARRADGRDWPPTAHTMVGLRRLDNLQACVEDILRAGVPGDLIETGVWRGGASIFMRAVLKCHGVKDRCVWAADSFDGLPPPDLDRYPQDAGQTLHRFRYLAVSLEQVRANFDRYGLLDEQVRFLKGWFRDTLPSAPVGPLAVIRLDGDMYESTMEALIHLYPKLSVGGYLIVDDYGAVDACRRAVDDYRAQSGVKEEISRIDGDGVFWRRSG